MSQFTLATSAIVVAGMLLLGNLVADRITQGVVHSHSAVAGLYTDTFIEPRIQELATRSELSEAAKEQLAALLTQKTAGQPIIEFRIWKGDTVVYSDRRELIGRVFPPSARRTAAWEGVVSAKHGLVEADHGPKEGATQPTLEIYVPVHDTRTGRIIALAETYQLAPTLPRELSAARFYSWLVVGAVTLGMLAAQLLVVRKGGQTIEEQRGTLRHRIEELTRLLRENTLLRERANDANHRVAVMNERFLRQIGADLHDGPVQMLGVAVLRLDSLRDALASAAPAEEAEEDLGFLRTAIRDTLDEIRNLSAGLAPPDTDRLSLAGTLGIAAHRHERRTGTTVACRFGELPEALPLSVKSCLYRLAQEGLSNSFRHAGGSGQKLDARVEGGDLVVSVADEGPGLGAFSETSGQGGQGLVGLKDRVEALGGHFSITAEPSGGLVISARFRLSDAFARGVPVHV